MSVDADRWYATTTGKQVAHRAGSAIILDFGKYSGRALVGMPGEYLTWLTSTGGRAFLPDEVLHLVEAEKRARTLALLDWPDARNAPMTIIWAGEAPAFHVEEVRDHLLQVVRHMDRVLARRADALCATLLDAPALP